MLRTNKKERNQVEIFSIEEFVPQDHLLRKIDSAVDFTHIYDFVTDLCPPSKNGHKIALKNGMNRNNSFTFVEVVAFIPRLACGRPLPIRLKGERTKQPHGQFASAQAYHMAPHCQATYLP